MAASIGGASKEEIRELERVPATISGHRNHPYKPGCAGSRMSAEKKKEHQKKEFEISS